MNFKVYLQKAEEEKYGFEKEIEKFLKDIPVDNVNEFKMIVRNKESGKIKKWINVNIYFKN